MKYDIAAGKSAGNVPAQFEWKKMHNTPHVPQDLLNRVVDFFHPRRIVLFGSHARGEAGPDSDIDLLVILDDDAPAEKLTMRAGQESRQGYNIAVDVIPVRACIYHQKAKIAGTLAYEAEIDGIAVYERTSSGWAT